MHNPCRLPAEMPELSSPRLLLRPLAAAHIVAVHALAADFAIADTTLNIPHPYSVAQAYEWFHAQIQGFREQRGLTLAVWQRAEAAAESAPAQLVGMCGLRFTLEHAHAELGYWIGRPFWGQGYATEAARCLLAYSFQELGLERVYAYYMLRNPASLKVLSKLGMVQEGVLRRHTLKWGRFEDVGLYAVLAEEWQALSQENARTDR